jgi:ABC-type antimicrobial peptide transport system permease subunit
VFGIYGVMAYYVQQHLKEISIRMALGGSSVDVLRLIVGQGMKVVTLGVLVGLLTSLGLSRLTANLLFGVGASDPLVFIGVTGLLLTVALAACIIPAVRGTMVDPAALLRTE